MKFLRAVFAGLAVLAFAFGAFASAIPSRDIHIIFDPATTPVNVGGLYELLHSGTDYTVSWEACNEPGFPPSVTSAGYDACLGFLNYTGSSITALALQFTVPGAGPLVNNPVDCTTLGGNLTENTCPPGNLSAGENVFVEFFGGDPVPANTAFFIGEIGAPLADLPTFTVTANPVPEPGALPLFATGLGLLGLWTLRRKRVDTRV
jgi:hypothetical protein